MRENENYLKEILLVLNKSNLLKNMILIGSWCLLFYEKIFLDFKPLVRTTDLDFFIPNAKSVKSNISIVDSLKELNYEILVDSLTNKTKFLSIGGFEVEFLTKLNRDGLACVKIGNTNIYAESLPYVDIFTNHYIEIDYCGVTVRVASPEAYVLQKLLINSKRKKEKQIKDIESIKYVLIFIQSSFKTYNEMIKLYNSLPKKWQKQILDIVEVHNIKLFL